MSSGTAAESADKKARGRPRRFPVAEERRKILDAAHRVFAASGVEGATIEAVARLASVPRPNVYAQFGDKDALFDACVEDAGELILRVLGAGFDGASQRPWRELVRQCYAVLIDAFTAHRDAFNVLFLAERSLHGAPARRDASAASRERVLAKLAGHVGDRLQLGDTVGPAASEVLASMLYGMSRAVAERQLLREWDREALIDVLTDFTCGGLARLWKHELAPLKTLDRRRTQKTRAAAAAEPARGARTKTSSRSKPAR